MRKYLYLYTLLLIFISHSLQAQFPYNETFKNSSAPGVIFGGASAAFLTAGAGQIPGPGAPISDADGNGYLRLTNNSTDQKGYIYSEAYFPSTFGLSVEFEYFVYGGTGADGIAFFLFDATAQPFNIGGFGGSLGYAPINTTNPVSPGVSKGYLGIGLDEFGNFSNANEGRQGGIGKKPGSVTIRGKGDGANLVFNNYPYLTSVQTANVGFELTSGGSRRYELPSDPGYRKAFIELKHNPAGGYNITVKITVGGTSPRTYTVIDEYHYTQAAPANLKYGFSSSTGSQTNFHEIRNLSINAYGNSPLGNNDTASTSVNVPVIIPVKNNDISRTALVQINTEPVHGAAAVNPDGTVTYSPAEGFQGVDSFTYTLRDSGGQVSDPITVYVYIRPAGTDDRVTTTLNTPVSLQVKENDISKSGTTVQKNSDPLHGTVVVNSDGVVTYTPQDNYYGIDSFTYILQSADGLLSDPINVFITIPVNPQVVDVNVITGVDTPISIGDATNTYKDELGNDQTGVISIITPPSNGTVSIDQQSGKPVYVPASGFIGTDSFTYSLKDKNGNSSAPGTITVTIYPPAKIGLAKAITSVIPASNGSFELSFEFNIKNFGPDELRNISLWDNLYQTFEGANVTVKNINATGNLIVNNNFNGNENTALLLPASTLAAGANERVVLTILVEDILRNGIYRNTAFVEGISSKDQFRVTDQSQNGLVADPISPGDVSPADVTPIELNQQKIFIPEGN
jgi:hypothetical protein